MRKIEKLGIKGRNQAGAFEILRPSASVSFRGSPWTSAECVGDRRGMRDGKYDKKRRAKLGIGGRIKGGVGEISIRSASVSLR